MRSGSGACQALQLAGPEGPGQRATSRRRTPGALLAAKTGAEQDVTHASLGALPKAAPDRRTRRKRAAGPLLGGPAAPSGALETEGRYCSTTWSMGYTTLLASLPSATAFSLVILLGV